MDTRITVIDVMREMGVEIHNSLSWSVGHMVRNLWYSINGQLPPKDLRRKTHDPRGVHCFALYPEAMRPHIRRIVEMHQIEEARQGSLFKEEARTATTGGRG